MKINRKYLMASAVAVIMILFILLELAKLIMFPSLGALQSHLITLIFVMIVVSAFACLTHKIDFAHRCQINKKQLENTKLGQALRSSEERYRAVFEHSSSSIILMDGESWENVDFNRKAYETLGYSRLEFSGVTLKDYEMWPLQDMKKRLERIALTGISETYETRHRKKNGETVEVLVNIKNIQIGAKKYFLSVSEDIGERKRIQTKAIEHYELLNTLMETIPSPVFYKDRQGKYLGCNRAFEDFFGMTRKEVLGKDVYQIAPGEIAEEYFKKDEELFENPGLQVYEWKVKSKKLGLRDVVFTKAVFKDIKGNIAGIIGVILDITDRKRVETELQRGRDALIEHNRILVEWTSPELLYSPDFEGIVSRITKTVADVIKVERVSLWLFNTDFSKLYCADLFEKKSGKHTNSSELDVLQHPSYFNALRKERVIVSNNSLTDPRYAELADAYVKPNRISSTLDVPVLVAGEIIGAICIEHQGGQREWTVEEQNFAISVGNIFSLALEISRHKKLEKSIHSAKDNFVNIVEKLPHPVLIVDMRGIVKYVNA
ncbi:MAG: PAS domain S-box protein, partial [Lentisphaerae bacterium]|nr:PAS domain S-box protein [Lentisphaerota bacterium]